jgi:NADPH:quinone reductase
MTSVPIRDPLAGTSDEAHRAGLERVTQAGAQPISWVSLAGELQRDWVRVETVPANCRDRLHRPSVEGMSRKSVLMKRSRTDHTRDPLCPVCSRPIKNNATTIHLFGCVCNRKENTMRAVTVTEYGATPGVAEVPTPEPGQRQVLIRLRAAGMNPMDRTLASGDWKPMPATFPMVLGADFAGVVEQLGEGASRFSVGDDLFGQLLIAPLGSAGTYAEYVAVTEDAPLVSVPTGLDDVVAAALPTAGGAGLALVDLLEPLADKTVLIVGAGGGVGSFATQFAANAGGSVIANVRDDDAERMRAYGATETIDHTKVALPAAVRQAHPDGVDVLIDLVNADAAGFAALASLVRPGGTAMSTNYVADEAALRTTGVSGINFALPMSSELLERLAQAVVDGRVVTPPITRIPLQEAPAALDLAQAGPVGGKTVITL